MRFITTLLSAALLLGACSNEPQTTAQIIPDKKITTISVDGIRTLGPYSQAVEANGFVFLSGIVAYDAEAKSFVAADIDTQTRQVFANMEQVLAAANLTLDDVVKTTVFLDNPKDFPRMNEIYAEYFGTHKPARSTVPGMDWGRDDMLIEIEAIALKRR